MTRWQVDAPHVATVDRASGALTARAVGHTTVFHRTTPVAHTAVAVVSVQRIALDAGAVPFVR